MLKRNFLFLLLPLLLFSALFSCTKNEREELPYYGWPLYSNALNDTLPENLDVPSINSSIKDSIEEALKTEQKAAFVGVRNGVSRKPYNTEVTGSLINNVSPAYITLLTQGNKNFSEIAQGNEVKGWAIKAVNIVGSDGSVKEVTKILTADMRNGLSGVLTYFPDGIFTFCSSISSQYNTLGWYQISFKDNLPNAIVYKVVATGEFYNQTPVIQGPVQGYGIWGIDVNGFFPLFQVDIGSFLIARSIPVTYLKKSL